MKFSYYILVSTFILLLSGLVADALPVGNEGLTSDEKGKRKIDEVDSDSDSEPAHKKRIYILQSTNDGQTFEGALNSLIDRIYAYALEGIHVSSRIRDLMEPYIGESLQHIAASLVTVVDSPEVKQMVKLFPKYLNKQWNSSSHRDFWVNSYERVLNALEGASIDVQKDLKSFSRYHGIGILSMLGGTPGQHTKWDYFLKLTHHFQQETVRFEQFLATFLDKRDRFGYHLTQFRKSEGVKRALKDFYSDLENLVIHGVEMPELEDEQEMLAMLAAMNDPKSKDLAKMIELPLIQIAAFVSKAFNDALSTDVAAQMVDIAAARANSVPGSDGADIIRRGYKFMKTLSETLSNPYAIKTLLENMSGARKTTSSGFATIIMLAVETFQLEDAKDFLKLMKFLGSEEGAEVFDQKEIVTGLQSWFPYRKEEVYLAQITLVEFLNLGSKTAIEGMENCLKNRENSGALNVIGGGSLIAKDESQTTVISKSLNHVKTFEGALSSLLNLVPRQFSLNEPIRDLINPYLEEAVEHIAASLLSIMKSPEADWIMDMFMSRVNPPKTTGSAEVDFFLSRLRLFSPFESIKDVLEKVPQNIQENLMSFWLLDRLPVLGTLLSLLGTLPKTTKWDYFININNHLKQNFADFFEFIMMLGGSKKHLRAGLHDASNTINSETVERVFGEIEFTLGVHVNNDKLCSRSEAEQRLFRTVNDPKNKYLVSMHEFSFELPIIRIAAFLSSVFNDALSTDIAAHIVNIAAKRASDFLPGSEASEVIPKGYQFMKRLSKTLRDPDAIKTLLKDTSDASKPTSSGITTIIMSAVETFQLEDAKDFLKLMKFLSTKDGADVFDQKEIAIELQSKFSHHKDKIAVAQIAFGEVVTLLSSQGAIKNMENSLKDGDMDIIGEGSFIAQEEFQTSVITKSPKEFKTFEGALSSLLKSVPFQIYFNEPIRALIDPYLEEAVKHIAASLVFIMMSPETNWMKKLFLGGMRPIREIPDFFQVVVDVLDKVPQTIQERSKYLWLLDSLPVLGPLISILGTLPEATKWDYFINIINHFKQDFVKFFEFIIMLGDGNEGLRAKRHDLSLNMSPEDVERAFGNFEFVLGVHVTNTKLSSGPQIEQSTVDTEGDPEKKYIATLKEFSFELPVIQITAFLSKVFNDALSTDVAAQIVDIAAERASIFLPDSEASEMIRKGYQFMKSLSEKLKNPYAIKKLLNDMNDTSRKSRSGITTIIMLAVEKAEFEAAKDFLKFMKFLRSENGAIVFDEKEIVNELEEQFSHDMDKISLVQITLDHVLTVLGSEDAIKIMDDCLMARENSGAMKDYYTVGEGSSSLVLAADGMTKPKTSNVDSGRGCLGEAATSHTEGAIGSSSLSSPERMGVPTQKDFYLNRSLRD